MHAHMGIEASPEVSVVIPVWDSALEYLPQVLESLADQGAPYKLLLVDNASDPPVPGDLRPPPGAVSIDVLRLPSRVTLGASRNAALRVLDTPWAVFVDADDRLARGALRVFLDAAAAQRGTRRPLIVSGAVLAWYAEDDRIATIGYPPRRAVRLQRRPTLFALLASTEMVCSMTCAMIDVRVAAESGGFGADYGEDWEMLIRLAWRGPAVILPDVVRYHRQRPESMGSEGVRDRGVLARGSREVRALLRHDRAVPRLVTLAMPLVALAHLLSNARRHRQAGGAA